MYRIIIFLEMHNAGGYHASVSPNLGVSKSQINDFYLSEQYLHLEDEFGELSGRLERRLPSKFAHREEGDLSLLHKTRFI